MSTEAAGAGRVPGGKLALAFAVAALLACWNPVGAPFALVVGVAAAILAVRARRRGAPRAGGPLTALVLAVVAALAGLVVLATTAGSVGVELGGVPVVKGRDAGELDEALSGAAARTRDARARARAELSGGGATPPGGLRAAGAAGTNGPAGAAGTATGTADAGAGAGDEKGAAQPPAAGAR